MPKEIKLLHSNNVSKRDNIAHSSGITITLTEFIAYINNCFSVLKTIQPIVLLKCYERTTVKQKWDDVNCNILDAIWKNNQDNKVFKTFKYPWG